MRTRNWAIPALFALFLFTFGHPAIADPDPGFPPFGSFAGDSFDSVNRQNLNFRFEIPLASSPGRGVDLRLPMVYDSHFYKIANGAWVPESDLSGAYNFGWKRTSPTGSMNYTKLSDECVNKQGMEVNFTLWQGYSYQDPSGTRHVFAALRRQGGMGCTLPANNPTGYATDNSGYYIDATVDGDNPIVYAPGGTQIKNDGTLTDPNGNKITKVVVSSSETDWKDSTGRVGIKIIDGPGYTDYLSMDTTGTFQTVRVNFQTFFVVAGFNCPGVDNWAGNAVLPVSVVYPNGKSYTFQYEHAPGQDPGVTTGRLSQVTLPTGGAYAYDDMDPYGINHLGMSCVDYNPANLSRVVMDGAGGNAFWQFLRTQSGSDWKTTVNPWQQPYNQSPNQSTYLFTNRKQSVIKQYEQLEGQSPLLRTVNIAYTVAGQPTSVTTILDDNRQSKVETDYDSYSNPTQQREYAFGTGAPGAAVRTTTFTYLNSQPYVSRNIINKVASMIVRDGGPTGTIKARATAAYDGSSLTCVTGAPQHDDSGYGCSFLTRGNLTSVTAYTDPVTPAGGITKNFMYDSLGNMLSAESNESRRQQWSFSSTTQWALPDSATVGETGGPQTTQSATYNTFTGLMATSTDENLKTTSFTYDTMRRLTSVTRPDSTQITATYDDTNNTVRLRYPVQGTDTLNLTTTYDGLGRQIKSQVSDTASNSYSIVETQYDSLGNPYRVSTPHNATAQYWTETRFDGLGRSTKIIPPDGSATANNTSMTYAGATTTVTDPAGLQRKFETDALGRRIKTTEPDVANGNSLTQETSFTFNVFDEPLTSIQGSQTRTRVYDALGRLTSATDPESGTVGFVYNNWNLATQVTDARNVIKAITYDTMNRLTGVSYNVSGTGVPATPAVTFTYGTSTALLNNGRLLTMTDGLGSESYSWNQLGQLTQTQKIVSGTTYTTSVAYNLLGEITSLTYPSGRVVQKTYDAVGRLSGMFSGATQYLSTISYNVAAQPTTSNYGNGVQETVGYSPERLQPASIEYKSGATTLFKETYGYTQPNGGNDGLITSIGDTPQPGRSRTYTYDALGRLTAAVTTGSASYPQWGLNFSYDRYANRASQAATFGAPPTKALVMDASTNRITTAGYAYDANGNVTSMPGATLVYDAENRLTSFTSGGSTATYQYDGHGLRVKKTVGATTTISIRKGVNVIAEYVNGSLSKENVYNKSLIATHSGATLTYVHSDLLSSRLTTGTQGTPTGEQGHYPFGESWYSTGVTTSRDFTNYERDAESGLDDANARSYCSADGRFIEPDRVPGSGGNPQSLNRYAYARDNPSNLTDPLGLSVRLCEDLECGPTICKEEENGDIHCWQNCEVHVVDCSDDPGGRGVGGPRGGFTFDVGDGNSGGGSGGGDPVIGPTGLDPDKIEAETQRQIKDYLLMPNSPLVPLDAHPWNTAYDVADFCSEGDAGQMVYWMDPKSPENPIHVSRKGWDYTCNNSGDGFKPWSHQFGGTNENGGTEVWYCCYKPPSH